MEVPPPGDSKGSGEIHALASRAKPAKKYPRHHRGCARPSKKLFRTFRDLARLAKNFFRTFRDHARLPKNFFRTFRDHARLQKKIPGRFAPPREPQKFFLSHFAHRFRKGKAFSLPHEWFTNCLRWCACCCLPEWSSPM